MPTFPLLLAMLHYYRRYAETLWHDAPPFAPGLGAQMRYRSVGKPNRAGAQEDFLFGRFVGTPRPFAAGVVVAERVGLLLPNASPEETARLAVSLRLVQNGQTDTVFFVTPDNRACQLTLHRDGTVTWQNTVLKPH